MDQTTLVDFEIDQGQRIVDRLDSAGLDPKVALWVVTPEYEDGRLVLASPRLDQTNSLKAYESIVRALRGASIRTFPPLLVLRMRDEFIKVLRSTFAHAADVRGMRLGGQIIGNRFVTDAFVYRIK